MVDGAEASADQVALDAVVGASFRGKEGRLCRQVCEPLLPPRSAASGRHEPGTQTQDESGTRWAGAGHQRSAILGRNRGYRSKPSARARLPARVSSK